MTGSTYTLFTYDIAAAQTFLASKNAPRIGGVYIGIMHPLVSHYFKTETGAGGWLTIKSYTVAGQNDIYKGEIGMIHGVRMVESSNLKHYNSTITVYPTVFLGGMAYGITELQALETIVKGFGSAGTEDALNQRMTIGIKKAFACKILNQDSIVIFESAGITI